MSVEDNIKKEIQKRFVEDPMAFAPGGTNNDMVDFQILCAVVGEEWTEKFAKWVDNFTEHDPFNQEYIMHVSTSSRVGYGTALTPKKEQEIRRITEHAERISKWLERKMHIYRYDFDGYDNGKRILLDFSFWYDYNWFNDPE